MSNPIIKTTEANIGILNYRLNVKFVLVQHYEAFIQLFCNDVVCAAKCILKPQVYGMEMLYGVMFKLGIRNNFTAARTVIFIFILHDVLY